MALALHSFTYLTKRITARALILHYFVGFRETGVSEKPGFRLEQPPLCQDSCRRTLKIEVQGLDVKCKVWPTAFLRPAYTHKNRPLVPR
jgi:hypothetical protein